MEQKKILWIVLAVSVFVLLIFGAAILLYSPSRYSEPSLQQAAAIIPPTGSARQDTTIDPDSWLRDPDTKPGLDTPTAPAAGGVNLTIVNRNEAHTNYGELDVTGLTRSSGSTIQTESALSPENIPGQTVPGDKSVSKQAEKSPTEKPVQTVRTSSAEKEPAPASKKEAAKKPASRKTVQSKPKTVIVTDYWIQAGSYSSKLNAERARKVLADRYLNTEIFTRGTGDDTKYRVRVGPYNSKAEADYWLGTVKNLPDFTDSYVSEVKTRK